mgnify:CR=1 FL=1
MCVWGGGMLGDASPPKVSRPIQGIKAEQDKRAQEEARLAAEKNPAKFAKLTEAVDALVRNGVPNIFALTHEQLKRMCQGPQGATRCV